MKLNLKKQLTYILLGVLALGATGLSCSRNNAQTLQGSLKIWKPFDSSDKWDQIINAYTSTRKGVQIEYVQKPADTYEADLIDAMASGQGPDVFTVRNDWVPRYRDKISPASLQANYPGNSFRDTFADVLSADLVDGDNLYGLASAIDTLVLYYNRQHLASAGLGRAPSTWPELVNMVPKLTKISSGSALNQSAIALGTSSNVDRAVDIVQLLMLQSGVEFYDRSLSSVALQGSSTNGDNPAERVMNFYAQFADPNSKAYSWNSRQPNSIDAFTQGKLSFLISYGYAQPLITAKQAFLDYGIAPIPQPSTTINKINYGSYWAETVWNGSANQALAWDFLKFATSYEQNKLYVATTGQASSRKDVLTEQQSDAALAVFADSAFSARSVPKPQAQQFEAIITNLINDISLNGLSANDAVQDTRSKLDQLLQRYPITRQVE